MVLAITMLSAGTTLVKWGQAPGTVIAFWRLIGATIAWWIVLAIRRRSRGVPLPSRSAWRAMVPAGLFFGADLVVLFNAVGETSIAHAEFIASLCPLLVVPIGALVFHERPNPRAIPFALVSLAGLAAVLAAGNDDTGSSVHGDLLVAASVAMWVGYLVFSRRARRTVGVVDFMATVMPLALLVVAPAAVLRSGDDLWPLDGRAWASIAILTVVTGMLGHGLVAVAQRLIDVGTISVMGVAQPAIAVCWAWILLGEPVAGAQIPGMAVVIAGLVGFTALQQRVRATLPGDTAQPGHLGVEPVDEDTDPCPSPASG